MMGQVVHHRRGEQMASNEGKRPTPALLSNKEIAQVIGVGVGLSILSFLFFRAAFIPLATITVVFALWIGILTPLAYRNARKHGEWPPKEPK
jgi:hypothetical protein